MTDRLFAIEDVPVVPLLREPRARKGAAVGISLDARFKNDYPPEWHCCLRCEGAGVSAQAADYTVERGSASIACSPGQGGNWAEVTHPASGLSAFCDGSESGLANTQEAIRRLMPKLRAAGYACPDCLGMGSVKARVRLEAGHRCVRCKHPYIPKGDAEKLGVKPSWQPDGWSRCDDDCRHGGPVRYWTPTTGWGEYLGTDETIAEHVEAQWRILTVHHLDGDKANLRWWNLAALCQRDHLEIQSKVVMERVYPHEHSDWFKPFAAGWYAYAYLGEELTRDETLARMDELLALERAETSA